jgi:hypothetical protein
MRNFFFTGLGSYASTALLAPLTAGALASACTISSPPLPDETVTEFCADYAKALCQLSNTSCEFDAAMCTTFQTNLCMTTVVAAQAESATRNYSQQAGNACINALNDAYGNGPPSIPASTLQMVNALCDKVVVGNQGSLKPCTGDNDCAGALVCAPYGTESVCAAVTPKSLGDPCADPGDECGDDSYCSGGATPQCIATPSTGGACSSTVPCGSADRCLEGVCAARADIGDPCATDGDCVSGFCDTYPPAVCTNGLTFARDSADCDGIEGTNEPVDSGAAPSEAGE